MVDGVLTEPLLPATFSTTPIEEPPNTAFQSATASSPWFTPMLNSIESNLKKVIESSIREAIEALRVSFETKICALCEEVENLKKKVLILES